MSDVIGKRVRFRISDAYQFDGVVTYKPCATGDSWIVDCDQGGEVYVQTFQTMFVYPEPPPTKE